MAPMPAGPGGRSGRSPRCRVPVGRACAYVLFTFWARVDGRVRATGSGKVCLGIKSADVSYMNQQLTATESREIAKETVHHRKET